MKNWVKILVFIIVAAVIGFNVLIYKFCQEQKAQIEAIQAQQQENSKQSQYQQGQIEHFSKGLAEAQLQLVDQKNAFSQEVQKRQEIQDDNKNIQTSLTDLKAEADAIKEQMKNWQKDYVAVLAQLSTKMDNAQEEIKAFEANLTAVNIPGLKDDINSLRQKIETLSQPTVNAMLNAETAAETPVDNSQTNAVLP